MKPRPRRKARAEVAVEQNMSGGLKFVRIRISQAHPIHGLEVKQSFTVDEGTAYQLHERLRTVLGELDLARERE